jgi:kinesin family member C2/C3
MVHGSEIMVASGAVVTTDCTNNTTTSIAKMNDGSNSVETTERCSIDDNTDPCVEDTLPSLAAPALRSVGTNPTEPSPHSSVPPSTRPVPHGHAFDQTLVSEPASSHPLTMDLQLAVDSAYTSCSKMQTSSVDGIAVTGVFSGITNSGSSSKRTTSPARTMNSTASAGSGGGGSEHRPPLQQKGEADSQRPPLSSEAAAASKGVYSSRSLGAVSQKMMLPRHPDSAVGGQRRTTTLPPSIQSSVIRSLSDPVEQEQALFEQRMVEDGLGVAIRKINQYGKSNLRYVRCVTVTESTNSVAALASRSVGSWVVRRASTTGSTSPMADTATGSTKKSYQALSWGRKKEIQLALALFTAVRKGKTTDRARRCAAPANRVLSLITVDPHHPSLDIEAPTTLDRDKFARAFARFLKVPLRDEDSADHTARSEDAAMIKSDESSGSLPEDSRLKPPAVLTRVPDPTEGGFYSPAFAPTLFNRTISDPVHGSTQQSQRESETGVSHHSSTGVDVSMRATTTAMVSAVPVISTGDKDDDEKSHVSSLTGHGYDQELVEELHNALNELRAELEESRAEAARAVKVAEQAIQSAERSNSVEWQNTVTHKAAEAAALAQKRSASAMAKQRLAEERLESERRAASFWRKQAEVAEEEAGALQTRAAAAEVQRAAMEEQLECERRMVSEQIASLRGRFTSTDSSQRDALESAMERNRALEMELDATRRDLQFKHESLLENNDDDALHNRNRKNKRGFGFKKKGPTLDGPDSTSLLSDNILSSSSAATNSQSENLPAPTTAVDGFTAEQVLKVHAETQLMRQQFELLKRATADHFEQLPENARIWGEQISQSLQTSQTEVARLQEKLAMESASRRKLLHEVQDLRGSVRVYCRPCPNASNSNKGLVSLPSHDTILLHREKFVDYAAPVSFEFDRVFEPHALQQDVYSELEEVCLGVLDGFNICLMAYGPSRCGKTCTLLGDVTISQERIQIQNHGIQLKAIMQLFTIAHHRSERYKDVFSLTIIEVHNDRIRDLVAATQTGESRGHVMVAETKSTASRRQKLQDDDASSGRPSKLEIRTDIHGDTVVQGLVAVEVKSFEEVERIWEECIAVKARRIDEQGLDHRQYDASSHVIATLRVKSTNITTGVGTIGKIQFVDMAAADLIPRRASQDNEVNLLMNPSNWRFANRSIETFSECMDARMQFERSVPYRNSTITHLLRDSLEGDTKVLVIACVSCDPKDINETVATLKFASRMRRVTIGKATKHLLCPN